MASAKRPYCTAKTAKGKRCKHYALEGADVCAVHAGAKVGRPSKLTDDATQKICAILRTGGYLESAAAAAGVGRSTLFEWMDRGHPDGATVAPPAKPARALRVVDDAEAVPERRRFRKEDAPFRDFRAKVEQAQADGEATALARIAMAATKDWKAAAWMLERTRPDLYAGPRGRGIGFVHPSDFADGEASLPVSADEVTDDQQAADGRPL